MEGGEERDGETKKIEMRIEERIREWLEAIEEEASRYDYERKKRTETEDE